MQYDWLGDLKHLLACPEQVETFAAQFAARVPAPGLSADQHAVAEELAHLGKCAVALDAAACQPNAWAKPERDTFNAALEAFGRLMVECAARKRNARDGGSFPEAVLDGDA